MDTAPHVEVRVTQRFSAPADRVFNAWLDPVMAGRWLFATASHRMSRVTIDARAGGAFRFEGGREGETVVQTGKFLEIVRPRRLAFVLSMAEHSHGTSRVNVEIAPLKSGCELALVHKNVQPDRARLTEGRWDGMLYGLAETLGGSRESRG
jgi:uncharacterized protein YndB with AHSA1/START domain